MLDVMPCSSLQNCFSRTGRWKRRKRGRGGGGGGGTCTRLASGGLEGFAAPFVRTGHAYLSLELEHCVDIHTELVFFHS